MSNDQIIRSSKPHEVTIPEGSNNARSIRNKVGQRDIEQEQDDKVTVDKHYADRTLSAGSDEITEHLVQVEQAADTESDRVTLEHEASHASGRVRLDDRDTSTDNRVTLDPSEDANHRVMVETQADEAPNRVKLPTSGVDDARALLPQEDGRGDNRVPIAADTHHDNRAVLPDESLTDQRASLPSEALVDHRAEFDAEGLAGSHVAVDVQHHATDRATLQDAQMDSRSPATEGATSSQPVKIPSDSIQDSFVTTPHMTHSESTPVKVDGHGITDPDSVIVENSPGARVHVPVPHDEPEAPNPLPADEEEHLPVAEDLPLAPVSAPEHPAVAQVTAHLVDKKAEEFRGRVVKLRDEVDQLNRRLDEFKK